MKSESASPQTPDDAAVLTIISACKVAGLSISEIRQLTIGEVLSLLELRFQISNPKEKSHIRNATQADIDAFLS